MSDRSSLPTLDTDSGPLEVSPAPSLPLPHTVFLGGIFVILLLTALKLTGVIVLPVLLAFILKMVLDPIMRLLERLHFRRAFAAFFIIVTLFTGLGGFGAMLSTPAADWAGKIPGGFSELSHRLSFVRKPIEGIHGALHNAEALTATDAIPVTVAVQGSRWSDKVLTDTGSFFSGLFETILVLFFLLIAGDTFLRRLVEILPRFQDKRQAVDISQQTERDISAYLATITFMNAVVGIATGLIMKLCGLEDPMLWGMVAFLFNYIPIIGPLVCVIIFSVVGLLSKTNLIEAFQPAGLYLILHLIEGLNITPRLVARRFTLNPVLVILSLIFWYWMWGVLGAILSTPLLAITKIICDRIPVLKAFGHFLEGEHERKPFSSL